MLICDLHCDLPYKVLDYGTDIKENDGHFAENKLKKEHTYVQVFANFVEWDRHPDAFNYINRMVLNFKEQLKQTNFGLVTKGSDLAKNIAEGKNSAVLSIEGGEALDSKIENIGYFYDLGVRFLTLTWNFKNQIGDSCKSGNGPLTEFGKAAVKEMNRLGMVPDVSHLSEGSFWSLVETTQKPIVATHSNAKVLCGHERNLTDEQFKTICDLNGLVGVNYYPPFLAEGRETDLSDILRHTEHFLSLGGENILCLGGDLDGVDKLPKGLNDVSDTDVIAEEMLKHNYKESLVKKIMGENVKDFLLREF